MEHPYFFPIGKLYKRLGITTLKTLLRNLLFTFVGGPQYAAGPYSPEKYYTSVRSFAQPIAVLSSTLSRLKTGGGVKGRIWDFFSMQNMRKSFVKVSADELEYKSEAYVIAQKSTHRMMPKNSPMHDISEMGEEGKILSRF